MTDVAGHRPNIDHMLLELFCDALDAAVFVTDKFDTLTFASRRLLKFYPVPDMRLEPGTRLRDLLGAIYDAGFRSQQSADVQTSGLSREEWIAERTAFHWRERHDCEEQIGRDRHVRIIKRRLANGMGFTAILDISDIKKREEIWKTDAERLAITEEVLDELPVPVFVQDQNLNFAAVNKAFCKLQQTNHDSLIGRSIFDIFAPDLAVEHEAAARRQLETGLPRNRLLPMRRPDGSAYSVVAGSARVGRPGHFYLVNTFSDVTGLLGEERPAPLREPAPAPIFEPEPQSEAEADIPDFVLEQAAPPMPAHADDGVKLRAIVMSSDPDVRTGMVAAIKGLGHDACVLETSAELSAFLVAALKANVTVDLVFVDPLSGASLSGPDELDACRAIAARHAVRCLDVARNAKGLYDPGQVDALFGRPRAVIAPPPLSADDIASLPKTNERDPLAPTPLPVVDLVKPATVPPVRPEAMVIEDNPLNQLVYEQVLESMGVAHRIFGTVAEAVASFAITRPALVLIDSGLPHEGCHAFARAVRLDLDDRRTPIIAVTPVADQGAESLRIAGITATLPKPIDVDQLDVLLRVHLFGGSLPTHAQAG